MFKASLEGTIASIWWNLLQLPATSDSRPAHIPRPFQERQIAMKRMHCTEQTLKMCVEKAVGSGCASRVGRAPFVRLRHCPVDK